jgi:hypothetical protein
MNPDKMKTMMGILSDASHKRRTRRHCGEWPKLETLDEEPPPRQ